MRAYRPGYSLSFGITLDMECVVRQCQVFAISDFGRALTCGSTGSLSVLRAFREVSISIIDGMTTILEDSRVDTGPVLCGWIYDDGGRSAAGYKGEAGDCVTRAIAIAAEIPYQEVYDLINEFAARERPRGGKRRSSARTGVFRPTCRAVIAHLGWEWTPTMAIGSGCTTHLRSDELPAGRLIASVSKHLCAVVDGVVHDISDPRRGGTRCVYGYYRPTSALR